MTKFAFLVNNFFLPILGIIVKKYTKKGKKVSEGRFEMKMLKSSVD